MMPAGSAFVAPSPTSVGHPPPQAVQATGEAPLCRPALSLLFFLLHGRTPCVAILSMLLSAGALSSSARRAPSCTPLSPPRSEPHSRRPSFSSPWPAASFQGHDHHRLLPHPPALTTLVGPPPSPRPHHATNCRPSPPSLSSSPPSLPHLFSVVGCEDRRSRPSVPQPHAIVLPPVSLSSTPPCLRPRLPSTLHRRLKTSPRSLPACCSASFLFLHSSDQACVPPSAKILATRSGLSIEVQSRSSHPRDLTAKIIEILISGRD